VKGRDQNVTNRDVNCIAALSPSIARRRLLRLRAAAEYLSLSPWKLRRLVREGRIPVIQDGEGSPFLLDVRDLDGYVERNKRVTPP